MTSFTVAMSEDFYGHVDPKEFTRWVGQTVPLRGPDRALLGEATVTSVEIRESGVVVVYVESEADPELAGSATRNLAERLCGGAPKVSFSFQPEMPHFIPIGELEEIPPPNPVPLTGLSTAYKPRRDDDVARWLERLRDEGVTGDELLDEYRARADYGLTLDADMSELPEGYRWPGRFVLPTKRMPLRRGVGTSTGDPESARQSSAAQTAENAGRASKN